MLRRRLILMGLTLLCVSASDAANIRRLDLLGFKQVNRERVMRDFPLRRAQPYDPAEAERARQWLMDLGLFLDVAVEAKVEGQVVDLVYRVTENPLVGGLRFVGNTQVATTTLLRGIETRPGQLLDLRRLSIDTQVIGKVYVEQGLLASIELVYEPVPSSPDIPVTVIFQIHEVKLGEVRVEPLHYVNLSALRQRLTLQSGVLLSREALKAQQAALFASGLFDGVDEPRTIERPEPDQVDVLFPVREADHPLFSASTLALVDIQKVAQQARFAAVEVSVLTSDLEVWYPPDEVATRLAEARAAVAAAPADVAAQYRLVYFARRADEPSRALAEAALKAVPAPEVTAPGVTQLRYGQLLQAAGQEAAAQEYLRRATKDPASRIEAYKELVTTAFVNLSQADPVAREMLRRDVLDGAEACVNLPLDADLEQLTRAFQFYYAAVSVSMLNLGARYGLRLDGPVGRRLVGVVAEKMAAGLGTAEKLHLGKQVAAVAFVDQTLGLATSRTGPDAGIQQLLAATRTALFEPAMATTTDAQAWFHLALLDTTREDFAQARSTALTGLEAHPDNERLIDAYVVASMDGRFGGPKGKADPALLATFANEVRRRGREGKLSPWTVAMLEAKLQAAIRDTLEPEQVADREAARLAALAAAEAAIAARPDHPSGLWFKAMALLKGPRPAEALPALEEVARLAPGHREIAYALPLAQLCAGQTEAGLAAMAGLIASRR